MAKSLPITSLLLFFFSINLLAQIKRENLSSRFTEVFELQQAVQRTPHVRIKPDIQYTAVVLASSHSLKLENKLLKVKDDSFEFSWDEHYRESDSLFFTNPIIFNSTDAELVLEQMDGVKYVYIINGGVETDHPYYKYNDEADGCLRPEGIPQSDWRAGLPAPSYQRAYNQVNHLIVHHAAGSNSNTNYREVVRSIYLFHTQTRGWSDIGYNYLIAQNGDLYLGRDPATGEQSDVRGAHFCGSNSGTMGVCLLGNYETALPSEDMINRLIKLLAWKSDFNQLEPESFSSHPLNASLGTIAGHRDGCATSCPGENVYRQLAQMRIDISDTIEQCYEKEEEENEEEQIAMIVYPNPSRGNSFYINASDDDGALQTVTFIGMNGRVIPANKVFQNDLNAYEVRLDDLGEAVYILEASFAHNKYRQRVVVVR